MSPCIRTFNSAVSGSTALARVIRGGTLIACALPLLLSSCAATSSQDTHEDARPEWVTSVPRMEGYFTGVGGANTGNLGEDREVAEMRARRDLAASISVELEASVQATSYEDSLGDEQHTEIVAELSEVVETDLTGVELWDAFHDDDHGYWALVRLSKRDWEEKQRQERERLRSRVLSLLDDHAQINSFSRELTILSNAWETLADSPHGATIEGALHGEQGLMVDLIFRRYSRIVDELTIELSSSRESVTYDQPYGIRGSVSSDSDTGALPVYVQPSSEGERLPGRLEWTDSDGNFDITVSRDMRTVGRVDYDVSLDLSALEDVELATAVNAPFASRTVAFTAPQAMVVVQATDDRSEARLTRALRRKLGNAGLPIELIDEGRATYEVQATMEVNDLPQAHDNAPLMSEGTLVIELVRDGNVLENIETPSAQEGGIDRNQAHDRLLQELLSELDHMREGLDTFAEAF